jgi:hypothetical protein
MTTLLCAGALLMTGVACSDDEEPKASEDRSSTTAESTTTTTTEGRADGTLDIRDYDIDDRLEPGTYFIDPDNDSATGLTVTYEVPEGWSGWTGAAKFNAKGHTAVSIVAVENVVTDACKGPAAHDPAVGPTVDDLATALSALSPFELTEPPTDVTLLGYKAKHLKVTVPDLEVTGSGDTAEYTDCVDGNIHSWIDSAGEPFFGYNAEPGRYDEHWILDVDGTRLLISINSSPAMPPQDLEEARAIIDSIKFET